MMKEFLHITYKGTYTQGTTTGEDFQFHFLEAPFGSENTHNEDRETAHASRLLAEPQKQTSSEMNRLAIHLNNTAVGELQEGNMNTAMESIVFACNLTADSRHLHDSNLDPSQYRFHWIECDKAAANDVTGETIPRRPFLYLNFLTISAPEGDSIDRTCPCGFAWAIWYK